MARFAQDCKDRMNTLTKQLETTLGPGEMGHATELLCLYTPTIV
jgi:hypothetical protein